jgi:MoxR-like ATPase
MTASLPATWIDLVSEQFNGVVIGQSLILRRLIQALIAGGHVLLEGVPGIGKTQSILTLARCLDASFKRLQFTPDLLPSDITGTVIYEAGTGRFIARKGPVFAHIVLADEINRAPGKAQSALLEAMQEHQVTIGDESFPLPNPFFVLATQNPLEHEATYPLPEAQLDRFLFHLTVGYPDPGHERQIVDNMTRLQHLPQARVVAGVADILASRAALDDIRLDPKIRDYIVDLIGATRDPKRYGIDVNGMVRCGASTRAAIALALAAKTEALFEGRDYVVPHDVKSVAADVLRHRIILTYDAAVEQLTASSLIERILRTLPTP